jgi:antitoxin FitA
LEFRGQLDRQIACEHVTRMNKHVQIKNIDEAVHRKLKIRAIEQGMSLSEYLKRELSSLANRPTNNEVLDRLRKLPNIELKVSAADLVREDRDNR